MEKVILREALLSCALRNQVICPMCHSMSDLSPSQVCYPDVLAATQLSDGVAAVDATQKQQSRAHLGGCRICGKRPLLGVVERRRAGDSRRPWQQLSEIMGPLTFSRCKPTPGRRSKLAGCCSARCNDNIMSRGAISSQDLRPQPTGMHASACLSPSQTLIPFSSTFLPLSSYTMRLKAS